MKELYALAHAKLNLTLFVGAKRPDGYHELDSVMQSVTLADRVRVRLTDGGVSVQTDTPLLPDGAENLAGRAAAAFFDAAGISAGAEIFIEKRIPVAAGLAGGSADAAAVLRALAFLTKPALDEKALLALAASLGADVPFCLCGGTRRCTGVGERLAPSPALPPCAVVLAKRGKKASTGAAYAELDRLGRAGEGDSGAMFRALRAGNLGAVGARLHNDFAACSANAPAAGLIRKMAEAGAAGASLSGSGPSVFGLFADEAAARRCAERLEGARLCRPAETGVEITE